MAGNQEDGTDIRGIITLKKIGFLGLSMLLKVGRRRYTWNQVEVAEWSRVSHKEERDRFVGKEDKFNSDLPLVAPVMQDVREEPGLR